jgi:hypothetical protein
VHGIDPPPGECFNGASRSHARGITD